MTEPNHFALLGLPQAFLIDEALLESAWRRLQAAVHPDRHAQGSDADRRLALQNATRVNEAVRVLRDPQRRAAYLCELRGVPLQAESNTAMPPAFLMQQMGWREALEEARAGRDLAALARLRDEISGERDALIGRIADLLDVRADVSGAAAAVRQLMFLDRLLEETDHAEEDLMGA
ncbi:MAG: Fe-S protein assembly co-chaperone HscB [Betaproteobacteria bacterium]|nr:Fe-S protein assembly co-chaperone HscB [Betaproteobacteria bacterium]